MKKPQQYLIRKVGNRRIERELDIVHFLRNQLMLKAVIKAQTTVMERAMAR
jgi:hypothetical protein